MRSAGVELKVRLKLVAEPSVSRSPLLLIGLRQVVLHPVVLVMSTSSVAVQRPFTTEYLRWP